MSTTLDPVATRTTASTPVTTGGSLWLAGVALAVVGVVLAVLGAADHGGPAWWVAAVVTVAWGAGATLVGRRMRDKPLGPLMGLLTLAVGGALYTAARVSSGDEGMELPRSIVTALILGIVL